MQVKKRNGSLAPLDLSQVRKQTIPACEGLKNVSYEEVELNAKVMLYDGVTSEEIQKAIIKSACNLISIEQSDYTYVAARLTLYDLYHKIKHLYNKEKRGDVYQAITLQDYIDFNKEILSDWYSKYSKEEIEELNSVIDGKRDLLFNIGGVITMMSKYLAKIDYNKISELPQHMHMAIAMYVMQNEDKDKRLEYVKELYEANSTLKYINPTPLNGNGRLNRGGLISCLISTIADNTEDIMDKYKDIAIGSKLGAGWGIDFSRIRGLGGPIGINKNAAGGVVPFLKVCNDILLSWNQGGSQALCRHT